MSSQVIIFLLLFGGVQACFSYFFFLAKNFIAMGIFFFCYIWGVMLLRLTIKVMNKLWLMENWNFLYTLTHFLPLLYLFVENVIERRHSNVRVLPEFRKYHEDIQKDNAYNIFYLILPDLSVR